MPWKEVSTVSLRLEFVSLATAEGSNVRDLCRRFAICPRTAYKWLGRFRAGGAEALADRSRRPHSSPRRSDPQLEAAVLRLRDEHPAWGPRKLRALLPPGPCPPPAVSTVAAILKRHDRLAPQEGAKHKPWQRFVAAGPNELWQMDFKGHFPLLRGGRCHPLTVLDDHSRFLLGLRACPDQTGSTVKEQLTAIFRRYGLPAWLIVDNGSPWGSDREHPHTPLTAWLMRLGIGVSHSRPFHPQTLGKDERLHRTLKAELLSRQAFLDLKHSQALFDPWRERYNCQRPHEALALAVPASRYRPSPRQFPESLPPIEYGPEGLVRRVQAEGEVSFHNRTFRVGRAFRGYPVGLRPTSTDGCYEVLFCQQQVALIDLRQPAPGGKEV